MDGHLLLRRARAASSRRIAWLFLTGLALVALPSWAADDVWNAVGAPYGGNVYKVIVDPTDSTTVYALSDPGVFESSDGGRTYSLVFSHPGTLLDMAMAPSDPLTLYATSFNKAVYKTTDGGATWAAVTDPVTTAGQTEIARITIDPADENTVYVLTDNSGVYKTTDGGGSWNPINTGLSSIISVVSGSVNDIVFNRLIVDPVNDQVLYLAVSESVSGSNPDGLYKSTNGGGTWSAPGLSGTSVKDIDMDPSDRSQLVAVTCDSGTADFYLVTGSGATPGTPVSINPCPTRVRFDPANHQRLYLGEPDGLYRSANGGGTWTPDSTVTVQSIEDISFDPESASSVFVSTGDWGVFHSTDSGADWTLADTGITDVTPSALFTGTDGTLYLGSVGTGVWKSSDSGTSWHLANNGLPSPEGDINVNALVQDPGTPATLYAGTQSGLYQTLDGGDNWSLLNHGITDPYTMSIAVDPQVNSTVYAGTLHGFFKSMDSGATWAPAGAGLPATPAVFAIAVDPTDSSIVFAGSDASGLYLSTDGGADFAPASSGLAPRWIMSIAFDPNDHETVYVTTLNQIGFFISTDGGANWSESDSGFPNSDPNFDGFAQVMIDPADASTIYLMPHLPGDTGTPVYFSTDSGADWAPFTTADTSLQTQAMSLRTSAIRLPHSPTTAGTSTALKMSWLTFNPKKPTQLSGLGADHKFYVLGPPKPASSGSGGSSSGSSSGSTGGGGTTGGQSGGGGGGGFPLLGSLLLLGFAALRRRR